MLKILDELRDLSTRDLIDLEHAIETEMERRVMIAADRASREDLERLEKAIGEAT